MPMSQISYRNPKFDWSEQQYSNFGLKAQIAKHNYHTLPLFADNALIDLLDSHPRQWLQAFTMGTDPTQNDEWKTVDIDASTSGLEMWQAVKNGRIWLNITHIEETDQSYADLITGMYDQLSRHCPHLQNPVADYSTLLISSPDAQVYYHMDAEPNSLWHIRGNKKVWIYPEMDVEFIPQHLIEDIYAGEIDENIPFDLSFDEKAIYHVLVPGEVASWPHNGPHRIQNIDLNVSLATSYYTPTIYKRQYVQLANRFLLRNMGIKNRSMQEEGLVPSIKRISYRMINKIRPFELKSRSKDYVTDLQLDPDAPLGMRTLSEAKPASFSNFYRAST